MGGMFWGLGCLGIETCAWPPIETYHVSMGGRFWVSPCLGIKTCSGGPQKLPCLSGHYVLGPTTFEHKNWCSATIKTWHVSLLICSRVYATHTSKRVPRCLEMNDTFTTCHWNNIRYTNAKIVWKFSRNLNTWMLWVLHQFQLYMWLWYEYSQFYNL
jgi:hypothetical protein